MLFIAILNQNKTKTNKTNNNSNNKKPEYFRLQGGGHELSGVFWPEQKHDICELTLVGDECFLIGFWRRDENSHFQ